VNGAPHSPWIVAALTAFALAGCAGPAAPPENAGASSGAAAVAEAAASAQAEAGAEGGGLEEGFHALAVVGGEAFADDPEFGAGHVGHALARALALLPVKVAVIDTRATELAGLPPGVEGKVVAMPEAVVRSAPAGSAFVILTHDHALDFIIAQEALQRTDARYVGMIGSRTKRARFSSWFREEGGDPLALQRLVMPIGATGLGDKRPEVIAALAAAEIMVHIGRREAKNLQARPVTGEKVGAVDGR